MEEQEKKKIGEEREDSVKKILASDHPRKVVVAGPGTGKSYLFERAIKAKITTGKTNFLAITFIGKLGDALADDLAGLADTMTLHGFARKFVLEQCPDGWRYYPKAKDLIQEDLALTGVTDFSVADKKYEERTKYYQVVGDDDIVHYAVKICERDESRIPIYDLILVDEFQDFNEIEDRFISLLATKNEVLIVGDDDQALYGFKGSSPDFIRRKFSDSNRDFESYSLKFCSRCPGVVIEAFHDLVKFFSEKGGLPNRIPKEYLCYLPEKEKDNILNPKIRILQNIPVGTIPFKIKDELQAVLEEQKIKTVLVIGEGRSCGALLRGIGKKLKESGFKNVSQIKKENQVFSFNTVVVEGYKILLSGKNDLLAWRLLIDALDSNIRNEIILKNFTDKNSFLKSIPEDFKKENLENAKILQRILNKPESYRRSIADSSIDKLAGAIVYDRKSHKELLMRQIVEEDIKISRPLANLDITVCNILGSKGLGADIVFVVGFDQGKFPAKEDITDDEVYQMLVALTRTKKRIYFINTIGKEVSRFLGCIEQERYLVS